MAPTRADIPSRNSRVGYHPLPPLRAAPRWIEAGDALHASSAHLRAGRPVSFTDLAALRRHWRAVHGLRNLNLLERAGLAKLRGDRAGVTQDLTEARATLARMHATGWNDYADALEA